MKYITIIFAMVIVLLSATKSKAEFYRLGLGATTTCGTWGEERRNEMLQTFPSSRDTVIWLQGYLTDRGKVMRKYLFKGSHYDIIVQWLDHYCAENPNLALDDALDIYVGQATGTLPLGFELDTPSPTHR